MQNKREMKDKDFLKFEEDIVTDVNNDFLQRQQARKNIERQWQLNMNFAMGNQYCSITQSRAKSFDLAI